MGVTATIFGVFLQNRSCAASARELTGTMRNPNAALPVEGTGETWVACRGAPRRLLLRDHRTPAFLAVVGSILFKAWEALSQTWRRESGSSLMIVGMADLASLPCSPKASRA